MCVCVCGWVVERERERVREFNLSSQPALACEDTSMLESSAKERGVIHYVHSASLAYDDGIVFMSEPSAARQ